MSIIKMKKLRVVVLEENREKFLSAMQRLGSVEISVPDDSLKDSAWAEFLSRESSNGALTRGKIADVKTAMDAVKKYSDIKSGLFEKRFTVTRDNFFGDQSSSEKICEDILRLLSEMDEKKNAKERLEARLASLLPWEGLDIDLGLTQTEHTQIKLGTFPCRTNISSVKAELEPYAAELLNTFTDDQLAYALVAVYKDDSIDVMNVLRSFGFSAAGFPQEEGTPWEAINRVKSLIAEKDREIWAITGGIMSYKINLDQLKVYYDRLYAELAKDDGTESLLSDGTIAFFEGWCPAEREERIAQLFEKYGCAYEFVDPSEEDIPNVPIKLRGNKFTEAFNMVTEMYSLPSYNNVDPNPLVAPFFALFYGIMMADMGYGILMMLAGFLINKKYAPKGTAHHLFSLMFYCGITTFIMGAITGGFFGDFIPQLLSIINPESTFELPSLFTPLNDTIMILVGCMALGLVHIITGMAVSVAIKIRRKQYMSILWEEVTWWTVFAGIALMVLGVTNIVIYVAIGMIVIGSGWEAKGFGKVTAIFGSLYNHVTGYFGDILSYSRLMALMLAGSVIASVFNTLGCIPGGVVPFIIISLVGNALNFALNILGCYVHDLRLQCLEFFGKFYEDGGKAFKPVTINTKYVDIK